MGEILAVSLNSPRIFPRASCLLVLLLAMGLTACGNDTSRTEGTRIAVDVAKGLKSRLFSGKKSPSSQSSADPEALATIALNSFPGPLIMASIDSLGTVSALGEFGRNGDTQTFSTAVQQTMTFRNGLLVGTRGLGHDLMSANLGPADSLIRKRQAGTYKRVYRYLDGEAIERPLPLSCNLAVGEASDFTFAGTRYSTVQLDETCKGTQLTVNNSYWVTRDGTIARSRQWIGQVIGYVTINLLRSERI